MGHTKNDVEESTVREMSGTTRIYTEAATRPERLQNTEAPKLTQWQNGTRRSSIQTATQPDHIWLFSVPGILKRQDIQSVVFLSHVPGNPVHASWIEAS